MTSASSMRIIRAASPIECAPVEQAVTTAWLGPMSPCLIETWPDMRLINRPCTKCGLTRPGPFSCRTMLSFSMPGSPPIPDPIETPARSRVASSMSVSPASSSACPAASIPKIMKGSTWRWVLWSTRLPGSKPYSWSAGLTSQAMRHFWSPPSKWGIGPAPLFDARMFFQVVSTSAPSGVTRPRPVTTTRRMFSIFSSKTNGLPIGSGSRLCRHTALQGGRQRTRSALVLVDIVDRVVNGRDLLRGVVRDLDPELFLESHHQLDDVEAVGAEIVDEARVLRHLVRLDSEMFDDDLLHPIGCLAHVTASSVMLLRCPSDALSTLQVAHRGAKY